jgi:rhodanese-related sulfurtransferase
MKRLMLLLLVLFGSLLLSACDNESYINIDNEELKQMLIDHPEYQYVDVRTAEEYYSGHVVGFTFQIDYYLLENDYSLLDRLDKNVPVVIMCNSGNRSVSAAKIMAKEGFQTIYNLEHGIQSWDGETE